MKDVENKGIEEFSEIAKLLTEEELKAIIDFVRKLKTECNGEQN